MTVSQSAILNNNNNKKPSCIMPIILKLGLIFKIFFVFFIKYSLLVKCASSVTYVLPALSKQVKTRQDALRDDHPSGNNNMNYSIKIPSEI